MEIRVSETETKTGEFVRSEEEEGIRVWYRDSWCRRDAFRFASRAWKGNE